LIAGKPIAHVGKIQPLPNEKHRPSEDGQPEPDNRMIAITYYTHRDTFPTTRRLKIGCVDEMIRAEQKKMSTSDSVSSPIVVDWTSAK
jgi:hypothetical protein